jgi:26S proteasome regulatory subunit N2
VVLPTHDLNLFQAIGIALESRRLDVISYIYESTQDISLLSYAMDAILDNDFSLSYRHQVLHFLFPLFPRPTTDNQSIHVHSLTRLLVTLSDPSLTSSFLISLVPQEKLLAYQFAFDLVEGGAQDFLETVRTELPEGDEVMALSILPQIPAISWNSRKRKISTTN